MTLRCVYTITRAPLQRVLASKAVQLNQDKRAASSPLTLIFVFFWPFTRFAAESHRLAAPALARRGIVTASAGHCNR